MEPVHACIYALPIKPPNDEEEPQQLEPPLVSFRTRSRYAEEAFVICKRTDRALQYDHRSINLGVD